MSSDFLTSLSSRAMQNAGVDSGIGGLSPRLASRFEPQVMSTGQGFEENIVETSGAFDANQPLNKNLATQEGNPSVAQRNQPVQREQAPEGSLVLPLPRGKVAKSSFGEIQNQTMQNHIEPIAMNDHLETRPAQSQQTIEKSVQPLPLYPEERGDSRPVPLLSFPLIATHFVPVRTIEPHEQNDTRPALHPEMTSIETHGKQSMNYQLDQPKIVPERIKITHMKSQLPISNMQQLLPAIARAENKPQVTSREPEPAPTINVTIGRIEVKATTPSPAPKRNASTTRTMSLDEYLQQRQRGQR